VAALVDINVATLSFGGESKQEFLSPGTYPKAAVELRNERFPDRAGDTVTVVIRDQAGVLSPDVRDAAEPAVLEIGSLPASSGSSPPGTLGPFADRGTGRISSSML